MGVNVFACNSFCAQKRLCKSVSAVKGMFVCMIMRSIMSMFVCKKTFVSILLPVPPSFHFFFLLQFLHMYLLFRTCLHHVSSFYASSYASIFMFHAIRSSYLYLSLCSSTLSGHPPPSRHHKILRSGAKRMLKATHHQVKDALKALDIDQYINQAYGGEIPGVISSTASKTFSQRSLRSPWPST